MAKRVIIQHTDGRITVRVPVIHRVRIVEQDQEGNVVSEEIRDETEDEACDRAEKDPLFEDETVVGRVDMKTVDGLHIPPDAPEDEDIDGEPVHPYTFRDAWEWDGSKVVVNPTKRNAIKQDIRDGKREKLEARIAALETP